ncbi:hypothetical protein CWATWH8502_2691 [Crocosphaera watsonii WH 8502]|uniref:Uncharacterized protein n=3 Tax=Crocosphaera watsonii TaxID=263511 RepID=G5IZ15_CROWT|nr:hypothetical protein CWATWH0003_0512 [Crocosphaera watsonii WH 0003]CCQ49153.1 hypothetical protein CWATWH8502_2691 [Crocosphaera watsonii WH 8502]CCQ59273.1 hypothetical protein CWATWH0005_4436 [Crocosphaera watsonii WH 0005]
MTLLTYYGSCKRYRIFHKEGEISGNLEGMAVQVWVFKQGRFSHFR